MLPGVEQQVLFAAFLTVHCDDQPVIGGCNAEPVMSAGTPKDASHLEGAIAFADRDHNIPQMAGDRKIHGSSLLFFYHSTGNDFLQQRMYCDIL